MASVRTQPTTSEGVALAGLFSSGVLQEMARHGRSSSFSRLARESGVTSLVGEADPVRLAFDAAFAELKRWHRGEYVFKATIAKNILLGRHSLNTAVMLTEFRVGPCKADVVILNGTSTAYEIKSDRDRLDRLPAQIDAYLKTFASVNVLASDHHLSAVQDHVPAEVGVLRLTSRGRISTVQEPVNDPNRVDPTAVFEALQLREAKMILRMLGRAVPDVPNTRLHGALREIFGSLLPTEAHDGMVAALQRTRSHESLADLLHAVPASLRAATLTTRLRRADQSRLCAALETRMADALRWG